MEALNPGRLNILLEIKLVIVSEFKYGCVWIQSQWLFYYFLHVFCLFISPPPVDLSF